jgi:hypothetical protein
MSYLTQAQLNAMAEQVHDLKHVAKEMANAACNIGDRQTAKAARRIEALAAEILAEGQDLLLAGGIQPQFGGKRRR